MRGKARLAAWVFVPAVLSSLVLAQARWFRESTCETYDEFTYLRMGICLFRNGDFKSLASPMCPPLPILLEYGLPSIRAHSTPGTDGWQSELPALYRQARLMTSVLIGVPLVWLVYAWLAGRRGWLVGALGGGLVATSPSVLAAASIATTDACFVLFALIALVALRWHQVRLSRGTFAASGAAIGLALASKQTAVLLFAVAMVELMVRLPGRKPGSTRVDFAFSTLFWLAKRMGGLIGLALVVDWAVYGFHFAPKFGDVGTQIAFPVIIPMVAGLLPNGDAIVEAARQWGPPLMLDTLFGQIHHASTGHDAFLMGEHRYQGWWYFFPVAIALKSTPAELVMIGVVVALACRRATWRDPTRRLWLATALILLGLGMASKINIGQRYMLLIYPLVVLIVVDRLGELALRRSARAIVAGALLLAWQVVSAWGIAPHYLGYFNSLCGGPMQGYRYLVDSSLDWGQDLPWLRRELEARGYRKVALCYFGTANAATYGLRSVGWAASEDDVRDCDWLAISATTLHGGYGGTSDMSRRFEGLASGRAGYSIFLYDVKDPRVRSAWDAVRRPRNLPPARGSREGDHVVIPKPSR